jgi:hypothetical protein
MTARSFKKSLELQQKAPKIFARQRPHKHGIDPELWVL